MGLASTNPVCGENPTQLPLFDGALILKAKAGLRQDVREPDGALLAFWRPVTFGTAEKPLAGRMDCKLGGVREEYSDSLFDIRKRYRDERRARRDEGFKDRDTDYSETGAGNGDVRRLEITGEAGDPHRHYVLTYLAMRSDPYLYDLRLNCEFRHLQEPDRGTDYAAMMRRYVDIAIPLPNPPAAPSITFPEN